MRTLLIVISEPSREGWAQSVGAACGAEPKVFYGSPAQAAVKLAEHQITPSHLVIDIGGRGADVLEELDQLAQQCESGTRVVAVGNTNDITLYRALLARGVLEYFPMPVEPSEIFRVLTAPLPSAAPVAAVAAAPPATHSTATKRVISFYSAASGDGASSAALNTAYAMSQLFNGTTVLVDMDYQFGMVAKHLDLQNQYGIRDLFDHPERGVDATLIRRMVANYGKLHVITAPAELRYLPTVAPEAISGLMATLKESYDNIILDLPHVWTPWVAAAAQQSTHVVLIAQLWLKSVSHAARMMRVFREMNVPLDRIVTVINRSGARFKEAIDSSDFERVCGTTIRHTLANDIKTITAAEAEAKSVFEVPESALANDFMALARALSGLPPAEGGPIGGGKPGGLFAALRKR
jgi:pilus assembly protein CpaE